MKPHLMQDTARSIKTRDGRDEMNMAEFPIALLSDRVPEGTNTLEFHDTIRDKQSGKTITRKLTITGTEKYGLPTAKDDEVLLALIHLTRLQNNLTNRQVDFSRYAVVHLLGWNETGASYHRVEQSLHRWASVYLSYENAWWDNQRKSWVDEGFHIIERVTLFDREKSLKDSSGQMAFPFSSFTWGEVIFRSFNDGYLKGLDLDFFLDLQTSTAKRMYRFLDKHFYARPTLEYDLREFAQEHVGLSRDYHTGKIKEKLAPAIKELEEKGFLEPLPASERYRQVRRGEWKVIFQKQPAIEAKPEKPIKIDKPAPTGLEKELIDRGVTPSTAAELVAAFPAERIAGKIDVFDWMTGKKVKRFSDNPAGYLVASIRDDYAAPKGFTPKAERERLRQEMEAKQQRKDEILRRKEADEQAIRQARREHIDGYLQRLPAAERKALEKRALASIPGFQRNFLRDEGPMAQAVRQNAIDDEVLRLHPLPA
jgi:hypothetical protein